MLFLLKIVRRKKGEEGYLNGSADGDRRSFGENDGSHLSTLQVIDAKMDSDYFPVARRHISPLTRQSLRNQRRNSAVQHFKRLHFRNSSTNQHKIYINIKNNTEL